MRKEEPIFFLSKEEQASLPGLEEFMDIENGKSKFMRKKN